jgi:hypothetical protein
MSDIRRLLESIDKLAEQAASSNVVQLPLGAPKGVPAGTQAFGQMGQVLTKPKPIDASKVTAPTAVKPAPGQKSLPGFGVTHLEPETPAYTPKQPWLDPKGSKEPAYMRKAAGITAPEPLGVLGPMLNLPKHLLQLMNQQYQNNQHQCQVLSNLR